MFIFVCLAAAVATATSYTIPVINAHGSHFEIGFQLGAQAKSRIQHAFRNSNSTLAYNEAYCNKKSPMCDDMKNLQCSVFPEYCEELKGIAAGSGVPYSSIMLAVFTDELFLLQGMNDTRNPEAGPSHCFTGGPCSTLSDQEECTAAYPFRCSWDPSTARCQRTEISDHCTDMQILTHQTGTERGVPIMGHNEDGSKANSETGFFWNVTFTNSSLSPPGGIFAYSYAGLLPGWASGWNKQTGVVITNNELYPRMFNPKGISSNFMGRFLLDSVNFEDALSRATGTHKRLRGVPVQVTGTSWNIGHLTSVANVEQSSTTSSIQYLTAQHNPNFHMNLYLHSPIPNWCDESSIHRLQRATQIVNNAEAMNQTFSAELVTDVLGDTKDKKYPLWRRATKPDHGFTLITTLYEMPHDQQDGRVLIWIDRNPKTDFHKPNMVLRLKYRDDSVLCNDYTCEQY